MASFYGWGSTISRLHSYYEETVYFSSLSPQEFLVLIWSTSEEWKAESGTPRLGIQCFNQDAIVPKSWLSRFLQNINSDAKYCDNEEKAWKKTMLNTCKLQNIPNFFLTLQVVVWWMGNVTDRKISYRYRYFNFVYLASHDY